MNIDSVFLNSSITKDIAVDPNFIYVTQQTQELYSQSMINTDCINWAKESFMYIGFQEWSSLMKFALFVIVMTHFRRKFEPKILEYLGEKHMRYANMVMDMSLIICVVFLVYYLYSFYKMFGM